MRGQVLGVGAGDGRGQIAGDDGQRYHFGQEDWHDVTDPAIGVRVDFEAEGTRALNIFREPGAAVAPAHGAVAVGDRNKWIAALLALFFGPLGLHRFYLGKKGSGLAMLLLSFTLVGLLVTYPWSLIDMVRYLMADEEAFARDYPRLDAAGRPLLPRR